MFQVSIQLAYFFEHFDWVKATKWFDRKSKNKSKEKILAFFLESSSSSLFYSIQRRKKKEITQVINKTRKKQMGRKKS